MDEVVQVEEEEQSKGAEDREAPRGEQIEREVFHLQRGGEEALVHRDKAHLSAELHDCALGSAAVAAQKYLQSGSGDQPRPPTCVDGT